MHNQPYTLPPFDLHCPMMSLPLALDTTLESLPGTSPYLAAPPDRVAAWQMRLEATGRPEPRVGLVWSGERSNPRDHQRSLSAAQAATLLEVQGLHFVSLQLGAAPLPGDSQPTHWMDEMKDFADTAALIMGLDLVVAVDTAVAHLAAALGKPVWMLDRFNPDWRWLHHRSDSPWYPTLRIYRQPQAGDWASVLAAVTGDLRVLAASPAACAAKETIGPGS